MATKVDFRKLALLLLPTALRKKGIIALTSSLIQGVRVLQSDYQVFCEQTESTLKYNGQVCYLRGLLNDTFDSDDRRISVSDAAEHDPLLIYTRKFGKQCILAHQRNGNAVILNLRGYQGLSEYSFLVNVPWDLIIYADRLTAMVNSYKLAGMKWKINYQ